MRHCIGVSHRNARLDQAETRAAFVIQYRNLTVQNGLRCLDVARKNAQFGILLFATLSRSRKDAELAVFYQAQRSNAVPLHFVQPGLTSWRARSESGEHR